MSNTIITCFKDDSIHAWETDTLDYKYQIPPPFGPTPHYRAFATPQDGRLLVAGGRSNYLHVWSLESRQLLRVIQLPPKIRVAKQLVFLPDSFDGGSSEVSLSVESYERFGGASLVRYLHLVCADAWVFGAGWHPKVHQHPLLQAVVSSRLT